MGVFGLSDANAFHLTVFAVYALAIMVATFPVPSMSTIQNDLGLTTGDVAIVTSAASGGAAVSKLVVGWFADRFGPRRTLMTSLALLTFPVLLVSSTSDLGVLVLAAALIEAFIGVVWPACTNAIGTWFKHNQLEIDKGLWSLSLSSRSSAIVAIGMYTLLLGAMHWRGVAGVAAAIALFGSVFVFFTLWDSPTDKVVPGKPLSWEFVVTSCRFVFGDGRFWLGVALTGCSATIRRVDLILSSFFHEFTSLDETEAGALTSTLYAGFVCGLLLLGPVYASLGGRAKRAMVTGMYVLGCGALAGLMAVSSGTKGEQSFWLCGGLVFLLAFSIAMQYYMIPATFAIKFGGLHGNMALVSAYLDGFAYLLAMGVYLVISAVADSGGWVWAWGVLLVANVLGMGLMYRFLTILFVSDELESDGEDNEPTPHRDDNEHAPFLGGSANKAD